MTKSVTIVDYGSGNIFSVTRALEHCGATVQLCGDPAGIESADRVVLPGVGAFADGMQGLRERALVEPLHRFVASGRPLLGICLGMQMLATHSDEFGQHAGLGLVPGRVVPVPAIDIEGRPQKVPHVGWVELTQPAAARWSGTMFESTPRHTSVYLVHSFHLVPDDPAHRLADCFYGGHRIAAAVQSGNTLGCQFHPEKSGEPGLHLLANFLRA